ncbi:4,5-DOPA dioxygenase extradiol [Klebsormidium nitens]|uniref:4,5-DOPA dioxygenase extradiol n=1 Tax=Klebsormidium nitens TaxID=105231 RepID=A0A1Y1HWZ9_KLENI|nr:4,5-DOPA dioxygenase extradiol [Klebsormidium nitens]|eukprot:GAQ83165.1 4,5-DOPA dioxygenase extradiol [Klebsormidium nitens]
MAAAVKAPATIISPLFLSHGSPTLPISDTPTRTFLEGLGRQISPVPKAILAVSAHWTTSEPSVTLTNAPETIHDFYGFPAVLYEQRYPVPGAPELARRTASLLRAAGLPVREDKKRGLDHGAWVPLKLMYPEAQIPVVQLSVMPDKDAAFHFRLGQALAPLKEEGVLVMGSGGVVHNLGEVFGRTPAAKGDGNWARDFADWLDLALMEKRFSDVCSYLEKAPHARRAHPSPEHFLPLHVALGAAGEDAEARQLHDSWEFKVLGLTSYEFVPKGNVPVAA